MSNSTEALSPLDGRYREKLSSLSPFFSETALNRQRVRVELLWLEALLSLPTFQKQKKENSWFANWLHQYLEELPKADLAEIKTIEKTTNHDVKAVEYFVRKKLKDAGASDGLLALVHFACTSEDINSCAYSLMMDETRQQIILPEIDRVLEKIVRIAQSVASVPMLSLTHGQPASPTVLGKELAVMAHRLKEQRKEISRIEFKAKMSGAVGNYNAHFLAVPEISWPEFSEKFIRVRLGLTQNPLTTQIENHDDIARYFQTLHLFNTILIGYAQDFWSYISRGIFKLKVKQGEVGSSTMPHKVNPIDFENAEGNLGLANSLSGYFSSKLPISRLQRDLSDSTVLRNLGMGLGYSYLGWSSFIRGLEKLSPNVEAIESELGDESAELLTEAVQTVMRLHGDCNAYEKMKDLSRGQRLTLKQLHEFVQKLDYISEGERKTLQSLTAKTYTGLARKLCLDFCVGEFDFHDSDERG